MDLKERAGFSKHPFHDINETQTFIAIRDGKVVGRIQAIVNQGHIERFDERLGFFGLFESIDDQEVADALFDTVRDWLADREIHHMRGPVNPGMNYEVGLLIDGWHSPPCFMMTYNPKYYGGYSRITGSVRWRIWWRSMHLRILWIDSTRKCSVLWTLPKRNSI